MAGLNLHTGNRLELLAAKLAETISADPLPPMQKEIIVVQSKGMQQWLNLELAARIRISANISYPFPKAFIYGLFQEITGVGDDLNFSVDGLTWKIMRSLPGLLDQPEFNSLREYCDSGISQLRLFQLSERIARLFDQYLIFRPDLMLEWDEGSNPLAISQPDSAWQFRLWKEINLDDGETVGVGLHPAALRRILLDHTEKFASLPHRISIFGISSLPPFYLDILKKLSEQHSIDFYYLNPCKEFWEYSYGKKEIDRLLKLGMDEEDQYLESGNPILASMGVSGREFFSLILDRIGDTGEETFQAPTENTLLGCIQADIMNMIDTEEVGIRSVSASDRSVQIHSCHTPVREVEILHDNLLSIFDSNPGLAPKDVVVMMPDVSIYTPIIQAVFDTPESEKVAIPYSIADTSVYSDNQLAETLLAILTLKRKRFVASEVLDILEREAVRKRFDFTESEIERIKSWVIKSGIKWGVDGVSKTDLNLPAFEENTWAFGIKRMLLGTVLSQSDDLQLFSGILPFDEIEGDDTLLLGRFLEFTELLFKFAIEAEKPKILTEWSQFINHILSEIFAVGEKSDYPLQEIRDSIQDEGLQKLQSICNYQEQVSPEVILTFLERRMNRMGRSGGFISRGVTFCTMLPMRSIPFKVIVLLGMNDGDFPRRFQRSNFDLMGKQKRLCDPSRRDEDKYLFLESVFSAREHLIISYLGQSIKDNSEFPPSVLVSELIDYLEKGFRQESGKSIMDQVLYRHALQPFNSIYFNGNQRFFSYSGQNLRAAKGCRRQSSSERPFIDKPLEFKEDKFGESISIEQFCRFYRNPTAYLIQNRLNIDLRVKPEHMSDDREALEADNLDLYQLRGRLIDYALKHNDSMPFLNAARAEGGIAHGSPGDLVLEEMVEGADELLKNLRLLCDGNAISPLVVDYMNNEQKLSVSGFLTNLWMSGQVFFRPGRVRAVDILESWIHHLFLCHSSRDRVVEITRFVGREESIGFRTIDAEDAKLILDDLAGIYYEGLKIPLPFFPETSLAYCKSISQSPPDEESALEAARKKWESGYSQTGESENEYNRLCFPGYRPGGDEFKKLATTVFGQALEYLE